MDENLESILEELYPKSVEFDFRELLIAVELLTSKYGWDICGLEDDPRFKHLKVDIEVYNGSVIAAHIFMSSLKSKATWEKCQEAVTVFFKLCSCVEMTEEDKLISASDLWRSLREVCRERKYKNLNIKRSLESIEPLTESLMEEFNLTLFLATSGDEETAFSRLSRYQKIQNDLDDLISEIRRENIESLRMI